MKTVYEKPISITIVGSAFYIGLSGCLMIQVIQVCGYNNIFDYYYS